MLINTLPIPVSLPEEKPVVVAKSKAKKEPKAPGPLGMVFWVDGGAVPNPGNAGWGAHGILFEHTLPTKGSGMSDHVISDAGYVTKVDAVLSPKTKLVTPISYFDGMGSFEGKVSNNRAEITALLRSFNTALEYNLTTLHVFTDSEYVRQGVNERARKWQKNNWLKPDMEPPHNLDEWKAVLAALDLLQERNVKVKVEWVKAHNGNFGNEIVDKYASIGVRHSASGMVKEDMFISPAQGYWKYDTERHPMLNHRRMYFNSLAESIIPGEYYVGEHGTDDNLTGKRMADGAYALLRLKTPDPVLEAVRDYTCKIAGGRNEIMIARVDYMFRADVHSNLSRWGGVSTYPKTPGSISLDGMDKDTMTTAMTAPRISQRTVDAIVEMSIVLDKFLGRSSDTVVGDDLVTTDLTSIIYESEEKTDKKGVVTTSLKLRPQFVVGYSEMKVGLNYRRQDGSLDTVDVILSLGIDLLDRNGLRRLEEENPVVTLVTWSEEPAAFRFATIIQTKDDVGIWSGFYSNLRLILPKVVAA